MKSWKSFKTLGLAVGAVVSICLVGSLKAEASQLYRAYNPNTGEHLYTQNGNEVPSIEKLGWKNEGLAWNAPSKGIPVYRMFNPNRGGYHHFTINTNEVEMLKTKGWRYEGVAFQSGGDIPVFRLYNPNALSGAHHFTVYGYERDFLQAKGWKYEGVAFYSGSDSSSQDTTNNNPNNNANNGNSNANNNGNSNDNGNGNSNNGEEQLVWTVWFSVRQGQDQSYTIKAGEKTFDTEQEAKAWITKYASEAPVSSDSFGCREIIK